MMDAEDRLLLDLVDRAYARDMTAMKLILEITEPPLRREKFYQCDGEIEQIKEVLWADMEAA